MYKKIIKKFTYNQLFNRTNKEFDVNPKFEIKINNLFLYNIDKIKIRGVRGINVFIDFFIVGNNVCTLTVAPWTVLHVHQQIDRLDFYVN